MKEPRITNETILARLPRPPKLLNADASEIRISTGLWNDKWRFLQVRFWDHLDGEWTPARSFGLKFRQEEIETLHAALAEAAGLVAEARTQQRNPEPRMPQERVAETGRVGSHGEAPRAWDVT